MPSLPDLMAIFRDFPIFPDLMFPPEEHLLSFPLGLFLPRFPGKILPPLLAAVVLKDAPDRHSPSFVDWSC
jgi:hypothetical protein